MDEAVYNVTEALKATGMWADTLFVFASDNGGPSLVGGPSNANNYPLRGGKGNDFEGGVRTAAFAAGGLIPAAMRGTRQEGYVHVCDWYATFAGLAGVAVADNVPGLPPVDALDMWPLLSGRVQESPRTEFATAIELYPHNESIIKVLPGLQLCVKRPWDHPWVQTNLFVVMFLRFRRSTVRPAAIPAPPRAHSAPTPRPAHRWHTDACMHACIMQAGLIMGDYKLVVGRQEGTGWWWGPQYPNSTTKPLPTAPGCYPACLFNILVDPTEHVDLRLAEPAQYAALWKRLLEINATVFQSDAGGVNDGAGAVAAMLKAGDGHWRPWL